MKTARALLIAGATTAAATTLSGCFYLSPAQTDSSYTPSDGSIATLGAVSLDNILIVTSAKGAEGHLQGMATNNGDQQVSLKVAPPGGQAVTLQIPAKTAVRLDGKPNGVDKATTKAITISSTPVAPGYQTKVQFASPESGTTSLSVPVLLDQEPYGTATESHASD